MYMVLCVEFLFLKEKDVSGFGLRIRKKIRNFNGNLCNFWNYKFLECNS